MSLEVITNMESALKRIQGGLYVTFEGGEGAGKSTQAQIAAERFTSDGYAVLLTRQPGGSPIGIEIRKAIYSGRKLSKTESLLFWADRFEHHETIVKPALAAGMLVIGDRDFDSSWAYQCFGRGLPFDWMQQMQELVIGDFKPHATFLYEGPVEILLARAKGRNIITSSTETLFDDEELEFHRRVHAGFQSLAEEDPARFIRFDATRSKEVLIEQTYNRMRALIATYTENR